MELIFLIVILSGVLSGLVAAASGNLPKLSPEAKRILKSGMNIKHELTQRRKVKEIERSKENFAATQAKHREALAKTRATQVLELAEFDNQIKEIERPAVYKMIEKRIIEASTAEMPTDRDFWFNEIELLRDEYSRISDLVGDTPSTTDVDLLTEIVDRTDKARAKIQQIDEKNRRLEEAEAERLKAPAALFDFLETVNDPDADPLKQMKATKKFVGGGFRTEDVYYGRITSDQLLNMAQKKVDSYLAIPNFEALMQEEAFKRYDASDNPKRLLELWGVGEDFNNRIARMD